MRGGRMDLREPESGARQHARELIGAALDAAGDGEHQQVHQLSMMRRVAIRQHGFDDEQPAAGGYRLAAFARDPDRLVVLPVVQAMPERIGVVGGWTALEKISGLERTTRPKPRR